MTFDETVASLSNLRETAVEAGQMEKVRLLDDTLRCFDQWDEVNSVINAVKKILKPIYDNATNEELRSLLKPCVVDEEELLIPPDIAKRASLLKNKSMSALSLASSDDFYSAVQYCNTCEYVEFLLSIYGSLLNRFGWLDGELQKMCGKDDDINKIVHPFLYGEKPSTPTPPDSELDERSRAAFRELQSSALDEENDKPSLIAQAESRAADMPKPI